MDSFEFMSGRSFLSEYDRSYSLAAYPWRVGREGRSLATYSALLQLGFAVPLPLPQARWALTPPFHPYLVRELPAKAVCFLWHCPSRIRDGINK